MKGHMKSQNDLKFKKRVHKKFKHKHKEKIPDVSPGFLSFNLDY